VTIAKTFLAVVLLFTLCLANADEVPPPSGTVQVPLVVSSEVPLRVYITQRLRMRDGEPVHAKLIEPIYAFDRIVLPSGVELQGHVTKLVPVTKLTRAQAILQGDFTPLHWARVEFTNVRMPDGRVIPIQTIDSTGLSTLYTPPRPPPAHPPKTKPSSPQGNSGILGTARDQAMQRINAKTHDVISLVRAPNKKEWLEDFLIKKLPYHPQWYRRNTRFDAVLRNPLEFGSAAVPTETLRNVGLPTLESIAQVRLLTAVSSAHANTDTKVEGVLSQPLFSADNKLLLPEGTHVTGRVRHAQAARWFHRGGQLRFTFDHVEPPPITSVPPLPLQRMEAQLTGVEANSRANVKVDAEGDAKATEPKTRLLGPALALIVAARSMDNDTGRERVGSGGAEGNYGGRATAGISGFGLLGAAAARASRNAGTVLGFYGLGWSVYSTIISRGNEVEFQKNTAMEIRFGAPATAPAKKLGNHLARVLTQ
jgi:hypothetical protein